MPARGCLHASRLAMHPRRLVTLVVLALLVPTASAHAATLRAPALQTPGASATAQALSAFTWSAVKGATQYDFQLAADSRFGSIVLGSGFGRGSFRTRNTAATIDKTIPDGTYFWRVRGVTAGDSAGRWSAPRQFTKSWTAAPQVIGPTDELGVSWPIAPLVLQWTPVDRATSYLVSIGTDPALSNLVIGDPSKPQETKGTVFAMPSSLPIGRYYWAVTPVDAEGHRGARSRVASFSWNWPSTVDPAQVRVTDLDASGEVFDPQLSWSPVPGAASYQVEISTAKDFPAGSIVCCSDKTIGTSLSPTKVLPNNTGSGVPGDTEEYGYRWRVRAVDPGGNAGVWNYGQPFDKTYPATVGGLHLRVYDPANPGADVTPGPGVPDTSAPIVSWDQVPGASSYEVRVVPYETVGASTSCNWSASPSATWDVITASTAWTPLGQSLGHTPAGVLTDLTPSNDAHSPHPNTAYCVSVRAQRDRDASGKPVVSPWTYIAGGTQPAFRYVSPQQPSVSIRPAVASDYASPTFGESKSWMPLFTWKPVDGAAGYFVVVARDQQFTKIADLAYTNVPAYSPRRGAQAWSYTDETTSYWWAIVPTAASDGNGAQTSPIDDAPQRFIKNSTAPAPLAPILGQVIVGQPTFRWNPTLGARSYTLQVASDPSFGTPIATVTTDSTAYTSSATFPADSVVYWRVRANDELNTGLNWSPVQTFRRTLPTPTVAEGNPTSGTTIPLLRWNPVQGAVSYGMHVDQPDGTKKDFTVASTAFAPVDHYGTGIWRWAVRANFPTANGLQTVSGAYFAPQSFLRRIDAPTGVTGVKTKSRMLLSWNPSPAAKQYRVEVSRSDAFGQIVDTDTTDNTSWAPDLGKYGYQQGGRMYWRVAMVDSGNNLGAYATGSFTLPLAMRLSTSGLLWHGKNGKLTVTVRTASGRAIRNAKVTISGAGLKRQARRSNKSGVATFRVRPRRKGSVSITAEAGGYQTATGSMRVI